MEVLLALVGLWMLYSTGHFFVVQHKKAYKDRTTYERVVTISGIICTTLIFISIMFG